MLDLLAQDETMHEDDRFRRQVFETSERHSRGLEIRELVRLHSLAARMRDEDDVLSSISGMIENGNFEDHSRQVPEEHIVE